MNAMRPLVPGSDQHAADHAAFVRGHTTIMTVPAVPELRLHLSTDAIALWERTETELGQTDRQPPFWGFAWPGGQGLARYLLDHSAVVTGRTVLDLGSGSGLAAIAAAVAGARSVLASDVDPLAIAAIGLNAAINKVTIATVGDVFDGDGSDADVVLAADIWYEKRLAARALGLLLRARARGAIVLASDVGRAYLPHDRMRELAAYDIPVLADLENAAVKRTRILTLR
jgi:predicted nicotinamide N-methyase